MNELLDQQILSVLSHADVTSRSERLLYIGNRVYTNTERVEVLTALCNTMYNDHKRLLGICQKMYHDIKRLESKLEQQQ